MQEATEYILNNIMPSVLGKDFVSMNGQSDSFYSYVMVSGVDFSIVVCSLFENEIALGWRRYRI